MKNFYSVCLFIIFTINAFAQTGTGVTSSFNESFSFPNTLVDSTHILSIDFTNSLAVDQIVSFELFLEQESFDTYEIEYESILIESNSTVIVNLYFTPTEEINYGAELYWNGNIFGSGGFFIGGNGILPSIELVSGSATELVSEQVNMDTISLGSSTSELVEIQNNGSGSLEIDSIYFSNPNISSNINSLVVESGSFENVTVTFNPIYSGANLTYMYVVSNDPLNSIDSIAINTYVVSELGGVLGCNAVLAGENSPYSITDDLTVNEGCTLTINPGVVLEGNGYNFKSYGTVLANGSENDSIHFYDFNIIEFVNRDGSDQFDYVTVESDYDRGEVDLSQSADWYIYSTSYYEYDENGYFNIFQYNSSNFNENYAELNDCYTFQKTHHQFTINYSINNSYSGTVNFYYKINDGEWIEFFSESSNNNVSNITLSESVSLTNLTVGDEISFKFRNYAQYERRLILKNIEVDEEGYFNLNNKGDLTIKNSHFDVDQIQTNELSTNSRKYFYDYNSFCSFPSTNGYSVEKYTSTHYNTSCMHAYRQDYDAYFTADNFQTYGKFDFSLRLSRSTIESNCYLRIYYRLNNGEWQGLSNLSSSSLSTSSWSIKSYSVPAYNNEEVDLKFEFDVYSTSNNQDEVRVYFDYIDYDNYPDEEYYDLNFVNSKISAEIENYPKSLSFDSCEVYSTAQITCDSNITFDNSSIEFFGLTCSGDMQAQNSSFENCQTAFYTTNGSVSLDNCDFGNCLSNAAYTGGGSMDINDSDFNNCSGNGAYANKNVMIYNSRFNNCGLSIYAGDSLNIKYSKISNSSNQGIYVEDYLDMSYTLIDNGDSYGISGGGQWFVNHSNIIGNANTGINSGEFCQFKNSILWANNHEGDYSQASGSNNSFVNSSVQYPSPSGANNGISSNSGSFDPLFIDDEYHLSPMSECVDKGIATEKDSLMPEGLGMPRSDLGIYGGNGNWFWGGELAPNDSVGKPIITSINDIPQDQGGSVAILFDASRWDDNLLSEGVTSYNIFRNLNTFGESISSLDEGNWEYIASISSEGFESYGYIASTFGDSSIANGPFNTCFFIIANTDQEENYWISDISCGNSVDNLSPVSTDLIAEQTDPDQVLLAWSPSIDDDFAYSEIFSDFGFSQTNLTDTTTFDLTVEAGETVTYGLIHYDVNGNPSDTSWTTIQLQDDKDYIALKAGWNLISTNVTPDENNIPAIMSSLTPGNLIFTTGFNNGVSVFDPNGLPFLNTLNQFEDGYGYWVKVNQDDTLIVSGELISHDFIPDFNAGWNLVGYTQGYTQSIETYFDFLLFDDNLIYATSFNQGVSVYDPIGLPFLNTLTTVDDNFGYWVKLNSAYGGSNSMRLSSDGQSYSPNFMLVNGTSNLTSQKGEFIEVLNSNDEVVAKLEILHEGYVMTSALYGDDKLTVDVDGLQQGELLRFRYKNSVIDNGMVFNGDMELRKLDLEFNLTDGVMIYPNPTRGLSNIEFSLVESSNVIVEICDVSGRVISSILTSYESEGSYSLELDLQSFDSGAYFVKLIVNNQITYTDRIFKQ